MSDQLVAETSTLQHTTLTTDTSMPPVGFEPTISAGERQQTYALDRATTGVDEKKQVSCKKNSCKVKSKPIKCLSVTEKRDVVIVVGLNVIH